MQQHQPGFPGMPAGPQQEQQQQQPAFGGDYLPTATAAPADAVRVVSPAALVHRLRNNGSSWMAADDINYILRIQHMATHSGVPYVEDFYFQVCVWGGGWLRFLGEVFLEVQQGVALAGIAHPSASRLACVPDCAGRNVHLPALCP